MAALNSPKLRPCPQHIPWPNHPPKHLRPIHPPATKAPDASWSSWWSCSNRAKLNLGSAVMVFIDGTQVAVGPGQEAFGGEPKLVPRGSNAKPRPAARRVEVRTTGVFRGGLLDKLMK